MASKVLMPKLGLTMSEGTIMNWFKKEGDYVRVGEPLFEIETDKATVQVEAPEEGMLLKVVCPSDQVVPVGAIVGLIGNPGEEVFTADSQQLSQESAIESSKPEGKVSAGVEVNIPGISPKKLISPRARRVAGENHLDWRLLTGTGGEGQITESDVLAKIAQDSLPDTPAMALEETSVMKLSGVRELIAKRLSQSQQERAHIYLTIPIDMTRTIEMKKALIHDQTVNTQGIKIRFDDIFVKATGICLKEFPLLNSSLAENEIKVFPSANIGIAVALENETLIVPVIREAERKNIWEIAAESSRLIIKAKNKEIMPDELKGGTFTITNLGMFGIEHFTPIINPPESGIIALGAIIEEPRVVERQICIRPIMRVTLAVDHRVIDGALAARFLNRFKELLEMPYSLLLHG